MTEDQYSERERAAIMEFDGGLPRKEADEKAAEAMRKEKSWLFDRDFPSAVD